MFASHHIILFFARTGIRNNNGEAARVVGFHIAQGRRIGAWALCTCIGS